MSSSRFSVVDAEYRAPGCPASPRSRRLPWRRCPPRWSTRLRAQDDETLAALLRLRPDLAVPPPADLTVLATRAGIRASVHRACDDLDTRHARRAGGARRRRRRPAAGAARRAAPAARPRPARDGARARRWRRCAPARWSGTRRGPVALVPAARDVVPRYPGWAGPAGGRAGRVVGAARAARRRRRRRAAGARGAGGRAADRAQPGRRRPAEPGRPAARSRAAAARRRRHRRAAPPGRAGAARRPAAGHGARSRRRTSARGTAGAERRRPHARAAPRSRCCARLELLIAFWGQHAAAGAALRRARRAGAAPGREGDGRPTRRPPRCSSSWRWRPTWSARATAWPRSGCPPPRRTCGRPGGPELRWSALARTWLDLPRLPGLVGRKDDAGRPISALSDGVRRPLAPRDRRRVLAGLAELPPGAAPGSAAALADLLGLAGPAARRAAARRGGRLGARRGHRARRGRPRRDLHAGPRAARPTRTGSSPALRVTLPEPVDHVLLQADLTAVAPGPLEPRAGRASSTWWPTSSRPAGPPCTGSPRPPCGARSTPGASPPTCTSCSPTRSATPVPQALTLPASTTWPAATGGCAAARRRRSCAPTTRC